jgi:UPF0755 protein
MTIRRLALALLLCGVSVALAAGAAAWWLYAAVHEPFRGYDGERFVDIPAGTDSRTIGERLVAAGVVRDWLTYRVALWTSGQATRLQAGEYRFADPMTPLEVVQKIARGEVYVVFVTFPEGLTMAEMARIFEHQGFGPASEFLEAASDPAPVRSFDPAASDLEGYLFPETYALARRADARALVRAMVARFERTLSPAMRAAAAARGLSVREVVTLASLVEKETARGDERGLVAAVYLNRLRIGMGLQCDPTVIYALQRAGQYTGRLSRADLAFDSPYNTYRHPGLPPGPIASPGKASLEATVYRSDARYLYFVSRNDGSHVFATTLDEHNRNVYRFQVQYFREARH